MDEEIEEVEIHSQISDNSDDPDWPVPDDTLLYSLDQEFNKLESEKNKKGSSTIFQFPMHIRQSRAPEISPRVVSVGPFFYGDPNLAGTESRKLYLLWDLLLCKCAGSELLKPIIEKLRRMEELVRECYNETIELQSDDFVRMLLFDSCFIICFLISISHEMHEPLFSFDWDIKEIRSDLLLLENQIPLFVVHEVYTVIQNVFLKLPDFKHILLPFIYMDIPWQSHEVQPDEANHLLHYYWLNFLPNRNEEHSSQMLSHPSDVNQTNQVETMISHDEDTNVPSRTTDINQANQPEQMVSFEKQTNISSGRGLFVVSNSNKANWAENFTVNFFDAPRNIPSATELHRVAGVIFHKRSSSHKDGCVASFRNGIVEMQPLKIDESRKIILTNLIGFEKSLHPLERKVSSYMLLMDSLINTEEDVQLLQECGIIINGLSNNSSAAKFFNEIGDMCTVDFQKHLFAKLFIDVYEFYKSRWNRRLASLHRSYFNSPWAGISVFAGGLLLILASLQTFYTVYPYYQHNH